MHFLLEGLILSTKIILFTYNIRKSKYYFHFLYSYYLVLFQMAWKCIQISMEGIISLSINLLHSKFNIQVCTNGASTKVSKIFYCIFILQKITSVFHVRCMILQMYFDPPTPLLPLASYKLVKSLIIESSRVVNSAFQTPSIHFIAEFRSSI